MEFQTKMSTKRKLRLAVQLMGLALAVSPAFADGPSRIDPVTSAVGAFHLGLIAQMKGHAEGAKLRPLIEKSFNLPVMASFAVGPAWQGYSESDRQRVVAALGRYTAARFAHEFPTFSGQVFKVAPQVQSRGPDRLVKAEVFETGESPVRLSYRLRQYNSEWQIIDVYYNGVSELATERAEFASAVASGPAAMERKLNEAAAKLN